MVLFFFLEKKTNGIFAIENDRKNFKNKFQLIRRLRKLKVYICIYIDIGTNGGSRSGGIPLEISSSRGKFSWVICTLSSICISRQSLGESVTKQCTIPRR